MPKYESEDVFLVPVPKSRLDEVYRLLGMSQSEEVLHRTRSPKENGKIKWWPLDRLVVLKRELANANNQTALTLLNLAAERSPNEVGYDEVWEKVGGSKGKVNYDLGSMTSLIKGLFEDNKEKGWWPVEFRQTVPASYSMPKDIADLWRQA